MARYREAKCKLCRREGGKLFLKGDKCYMEKCPFNKRPVAPGQHGADRKKVSEYGLQLREKQKTKRIYGVQEGQFRKYYEMADRMKGVTGENMLKLLESRLDNLVYRIGFGNSIRQARQMVNHGHILVNGRRVDIPSYHCKPGDVIELREASRDNEMFKTNFQELRSFELPYIEKDLDAFKGTYTRMPEREELPIEVNETLIVELYSK